MNKVMLMGRLTADPEQRTTAAGTRVIRFTVAVNRRFPKEGQPQADFIVCTAWAKTAEFVGKWFGKGSMIAIVGSIRTNKWTDKDGHTRTSTEVIVDEAYFTGEKSGKKASNNSIDNDDFGYIGGDEGDLPF